MADHKKDDDIAPFADAVDRNGALIGAIIGLLFVGVLIVNMAKSIGGTGGWIFGIVLFVVVGAALYIWFKPDSKGGE